MVSRNLLLSSLLLTLALLLVAGSGAAEDVSRSCAADIDRAAGNYSRCLLGAQARNARRPGRSSLESAEQRCADRFDAATTRALARAEQRQETCTPFLAELADRTVAYAQGAASEAGGKPPAASVLFVQNGTGGTLSGANLTLMGVGSQTGYFSDRPHRLAGHMPTEDFIGLWDEGEPFADDPPNAALSCTVDSEVVNYVVELTSPFLCNTDDCPVHELSYLVAAVGDTVLPETPIACEGEANLFIDSCVEHEGSGVQQACLADGTQTGCDCRRACKGECGGPQEQQWCRDIGYDDGFKGVPSAYCNHYRVEPYTCSDGLVPCSDPSYGCCNP